MTNLSQEYDLTKLIYASVTVIAVPELIIFGIAYSTTFLNVLVNPEKETSRFLAVINLCLILCIRFMYAVFFLLALPDAYSTSFSITLASIRQVFITVIAGWWILTICVPAFVGLLSWSFRGVGNIKRDSSSIKSLPKFICILPVYNETLENLVNAIQAILNSNYPSELIEIHVAFDDPKISPLYKELLTHFIPLVVPQDLPATFQWITMESSVLYFHRWPHGGKRSAQAHTWAFIQKQCLFDQEPIFILTDSDNVMLNEAFNNLAIEFHHNPKKIAFAGYMSCLSNPRKSLNLIRMIQDTEYVSNEINRFFELMLGTVNCLPGGFTAVKYSTLEKIAPHYFTELKVNNITQYHQYILGEDRYLTHLTHKMFQGHSVGFCPMARCKTDPPDSVMKFVRQRRRWLLGCIANEAFMLSTPLLWSKFPLLLIFKIIQTSWRSTTFCQLLVLICAVTELLKGSSESKRNFMLSTMIPLWIAWMAGSLAGFFLKRFKIFFLWPFMLIAQTFLAVLIDYYALFTWKVRTWGGPRFASGPSEATKVAVKNESVFGKPIVLVPEPMESSMREIVYC